MAYFYEGTCSECDFRSLFVAEWKAVRTRIGTIEPLHHPLEGAILKDLGFTWEEAERERRLLYFHAGACATCGARSDLDAQDPRMIALQGSPWPMRFFIAGGVIFFALAEVLIWLAAGETRWPWLARLTMMPGLGILAIGIYFWLAAGFSDTVERYRGFARRLFPRVFRKPELQPSGIPCTVCESGQVYPLGQLPQRAFACPKCSAPSYRYAMSAIIS